MSDGSLAKGMVCSGHIVIIIVIVVKFKRPEAVNNILRIKGQKGSAKSLSQDQTPGTVIYKKEPEFTDEVCFSFQILKSHLSLHSPPPKTKDLL